MARNKSRFQPGSAHPKWTGEPHRMTNGYQRIKHGKYRDWLAHRVVTMQLLEEKGAVCFWPLDKKGFPYVPGENGEVLASFQVHHMDKNKRHNCWCNLLLLDERLHVDARWPTVEEMRLKEKQAQPQQQDEEPPDWVTQKDF